MSQIWTNYDQKGDRIIAFTNGTLYKANPKTDEIDNIVRDMQMNDFSASGLFGIPQDYIKEIRLQEGNDYIQVFFSHDSEEHYRIIDATKREEVFNYLKDHVPNTSYKVDRYDKMRAGKKPMIALIIVSLFFLWSLYLAVNIEAGYEYTTNGRITGLVLGIASMGIKKVILIFGALIAIAATSMIRKMKNPPVMHIVRIAR